MRLKTRLSGRTYEFKPVKELLLIVREVSNRLQRADPPDPEEEYHRWRYSVISGSGGNDS